MARAPAPATIRTAPLSRGAAQLLSPMVHEVFACEAATRAGDPEAGIHDMRVATKRLREAMRLFRPAFRKKDYRKHLAWIEELNDALGEVRDLDVLIPRLEKRAGKLGRPEGMRALLARLERRREGARSWLVSRLDRLRNRALPAKLEARLGRMATAADEGETSVERFAREAIQEQLATVKARWEAVRLSATPRTFHRARIANKHLRYALEPFLSFLEGAPVEIYELSSKLHDALGDMHDEDELIRIVETEMACCPHPERDAWELLAKNAEQRRRNLLRATLRRADPLVDGGWDRLKAALMAEDAMATPDQDGPVEAAVAASVAGPDVLELASVPVPRPDEDSPDEPTKH
ncbi:MAG TPA: CHAD domain-containing protein [bacterium]|nr:CHAD domain-containing protein [bacterium]